MAGAQIARISLNGCNLIYKMNWLQFPDYHSRFNLFIYFFLEILKLIITRVWVLAPCMCLFCVCLLVCFVIYIQSPSAFKREIVRCVCA